MQRLPLTPRVPRGAPFKAVAMASALAMVLAGQTMAADPDPVYRADITPGAAAAGTPVSFTVIITHLAPSSRELGSVRIAPPPGIILTSASAKRGSHVLPVSVAGNRVTVDTANLNDDHETASVKVQADVPCGVSGGRTWTVEAIKNRSFSDGGPLLPQAPSSELTTQVDRCTLAFATQPASAAVDTVITSDVADPSGTPIRVQLRDGNGDPAALAGIEVALAITSGTGDAGATLHGDRTDSTNSNGVAAFAPTIDQAERGYRLEASATTSGIGDANTSSAFDISDVAVTCSGACSGSSQKDDTSATVSAESNGVLSFSLGLDDIDCDNGPNRFYKSSSEVLTFDVTSGAGRTMVTITLAASSVTKVAKKYEVCFSSPLSSFTNAYGAAIVAGQAGLLPGCPRKLAGGPCVLSKERDRTGSIVVRFSVPSGDPRGKI